MLDSMRNMPELRGVDPNNMSAIVGGRDEIVQPPGRLIGRANLTNGSYEDGRLRDVISGHYGVDSYVAHNYVTSIYGRGGYSSANYGSGGYSSGNYVSSENALSERIGGLSTEPGFRVADSVFESFFGPRMNQPSPLGSLAGNVSGGNGGNGGFGLGDFTFNAGENAGRLGSGAFDLGEGSGWNPNRGPDGDPGGGPGGSADAMYGAYRNQIVSRDDSSYYKALAFLAVHDRDDDTIQGGYGEDVLCGGEGDDNLGMPTPVNQAQANQILASKGQDPNYHLEQTIKASIDEQKPRVIGDGGTGGAERTQQYVRNLIDREFDPIAPYYPEDIAADPGFEPKKFSEIKENLERDVFNPESLPGGHSGPVGSLGNSLVAGSAIAGEYLEYGLSNIGYAAAHIPGVKEVGAAFGTVLHVTKDGVVWGVKQVAPETARNLIEEFNALPHGTQFLISAGVDTALLAGAGSLAKNVVPGKNVGKSSVMSEVEQSALLQQASEITLGKKFTADIATIKQLPKPKLGKINETTEMKISKAPEHNQLPTTDTKFVVSNKNLRAVLEQTETQTILKKPNEMKISKAVEHNQLPTAEISKSGEIQKTIAGSLDSNVKWVNKTDDGFALDKKYEDAISGGRGSSIFLDSANLEKLDVLHQKGYEHFEQGIKKIETAIANKTPISWLPRELVNDFGFMLKTSGGKVTGFHHMQEHHILMKSRPEFVEAFSKAGTCVEKDPNNLIHLPDAVGKDMYPTDRSLHSGMHAGKSYDHLLKKVEKAQDRARDYGYTHKERKDAIYDITAEERVKLETGERELNEAKTKGEKLNDKE